MFQEQGMCCGRQRSPLASCRDVTRTEIGHSGNPRSLGNDRRFCDLESGTNGSDARRMDPMRKMVQSLAMRADQRDIIRLKFRLSDDMERRVCEPFTKQRIEMTHIRDRSRD
jgi:hypothetical protein